MQTQIQFSFNARRDWQTKDIKDLVQPQTEAWTPRVLFEPQTPPPFPHPSPTAEGSLAEELAAWAELDGFEAEEVERSFPDVAEVAPSLVEKPKLSGDGKGVVDRLFKAGLEAWLDAGWEGREPIGPIEPMGPVAVLDGNCLEEGDVAPLGDDVDVTGCSALPSYIL